ncbi:MAG: hypothetical protein ACLVF0_01025 [Dorea formicigenerans]
MKELLEKILGQIKKTPSGVRAYEDLYHICLETQKTDIPLSVEYLKKLSDIIENRIPQSETDKELRSLFMLHKKVLLAAAPFDFESYLLYVEWERDGTFYLAFREKTKEEKLVAALNATSNSITDVQVALAEVYEMVLGGN